LCTAEILSRFQPHQDCFDELRASPELFADETTAPVLDPGRGRTKTGQLWV
jgi:hypothetical protein